MSYFEYFKNAMIEKYNSENAGERNLRLVFCIEDQNMNILIEISGGLCNIQELLSVSVDFEFDLLIQSTSNIFDRIISDTDELTGVDAYFEGELEIDGDRVFLEDLFEVFGIV